jgi:hypothetical protein
MGLQLSILPKISTDAKKLIFTETTGIYSVTNTTGWGSPNPLISECQTVGSTPGAILTVLTPDDNFITMFSYDPSLGGTQFPETTGLQEKNLYYYSSGYTTTYNATATPVNMPDGVYTFTYTINSVNYVSKIATIYSTTYYLLVTTGVACCVDKLFHLASQADCTDCKNEKLSKALEAESYLKAAEYANACGKNNMAAKHLSKAQWICSEQNCLNC